MDQLISKHLEAQRILIVKHIAYILNKNITDIYKQIRSSGTYNYVGIRFDNTSEYSFQLNNGRPVAIISEELKDEELSDLVSQIVEKDLESTTYMRLLVRDQNKLPHEDTVVPGEVIYDTVFDYYEIEVKTDINSLGQIESKKVESLVSSHAPPVIKTEEELKNHLLPPPEPQKKKPAPKQGRIDKFIRKGTREM